MPWNEDAFQARAMARAKELGINSAAELMRKAGLAENTFSKTPGSQGRTYNIIEAIAGSLDWTVAEAIGQSLNERLMRLAVEIAIDAVASRERELLADAVLSAYEVLSGLDADGLTIDASARATLAASLRQRTTR